MSDKIEVKGSSYKQQLERTMDLLQKEVQVRCTAEKVLNLHEELAGDEDLDKANGRSKNRK
jgi:hypothetical protein